MRDERFLEKVGDPAARLAYPTIPGLIAAQVKTRIVGAPLDILDRHSSRCDRPKRVKTIPAHKPHCCHREGNKSVNGA